MKNNSQQPLRVLCVCREVRIVLLLQLLPDWFRFRSTRIFRVQSKRKTCRSFQNLWYAFRRIFLQTSAVFLKQQNCVGTFFWKIKYLRCPYTSLKDTEYRIYYFRGMIFSQEYCGVTHCKICVFNQLLEVDMGKSTAPITTVLHLPNSLDILHEMMTGPRGLVWKDNPKV